MSNLDRVYNLITMAMGMQDEVRIGLLKAQGIFKDMKLKEIQEAIDELVNREKFTYESEYLYEGHNEIDTGILIIRRVVK